MEPNSNVRQDTDHHVFPSQDEAGSGLTYATVRHTKQRPPAKMKVSASNLLD